MKCHVFCRANILDHLSQVVFLRTKGKNDRQSDIGIDNLRITPGKCTGNATFAYMHYRFFNLIFISVTSAFMQHTYNAEHISASIYRDTPLVVLLSRYQVCNSNMHQHQTGHVSLSNGV